MAAIERKNVGTVDALIRITVGAALLGAGASRRFAGPIAGGLLLLGGWKLAEGIVRWDPLWEALGIDTRDEFGRRVNPYANYPTYEEEAEAFERTHPFKRRVLRRGAARAAEEEGASDE